MSLHPGQDLARLNLIRCYRHFVHQSYTDPSCFACTGVAQQRRSTSCLSRAIEGYANFDTGIPLPLSEAGRSQLIKRMSTATLLLWCSRFIWVVVTCPRSMFLSISSGWISQGASITSLKVNFCQNLHQQHKQVQWTAEIRPVRPMFFVL